MNKIQILIAHIILFVCLALSGHSQDSGRIYPLPLSVSYAKTTNLIFPYAITSVDRGSKNILVQKAVGVENVLQVKAASRDFPETNLTVITADGSLFSYMLTYAESPANLNIRAERHATRSRAIFTKNATNDVIARNAAKVAAMRRSRQNNMDKAKGAVINIKGIYVQEDVFYFQLELKNTSRLNYEIKGLRLFIKDKKKSRRTASQEVDISPLYVLGNMDAIRANSEQVVVVAFPKFTIPDKKDFIIEMQEENGGRNLSLKVRDRELAKSKFIL